MRFKASIPYLDHKVLQDANLFGNELQALKLYKTFSDL